jgi:hypothetical protein
MVERRAVAGRRSHVLSSRRIGESGVKRPKRGAGALRGRQM